MTFKAGKKLDRVKVIQKGNSFRVTLAGITYKGTKKQIQKIIANFNDGIIEIENPADLSSHGMDNPNEGSN